MTATLKLYELSDQLQAIADTLVENGGELTPELSAELASLEGAFEHKVERVLLYVRNLESLAVAAQQEAARLRGLAVSRESAAKRLKDYVREEMERAGKPKVETGLIVARIQSNSRPSITYAGDMALLPAAYVRTRTEFNGDAAYEAWKANVTLPAGVVVALGTHLRVK